MFACRMILIVSPFERVEVDCSKMWKHPLYMQKDAVCMNLSLCMLNRVRLTKVFWVGMPTAHRACLKTFCMFLSFLRRNEYLLNCLNGD